MKKLILAAALILSATPSFSEIIIEKSGRGLFGRWFRVVEENDGVLNCHGLGLIRCRAMFPTFFAGNPTPLSESNYDAIDTYIESSVTEMNTSGTFIYANEYYITYNYNQNVDKLTIHIYSINEAQELNLIN